MKVIYWLVLIFISSLAQAQNPPIQPKIPTAEEALAAWELFRAEPLTRLDRTQPFIDFIRDSGQVHIVLNQALLGWMYEPIDAELKAVIYAAFLGSNMAAQLARGKAPGVEGGDDLAAISGALAAYSAVRTAHPTVTIALFEQLTEAERAGNLAATVANLAANPNAK
jgi:hypothetical protein